MNNRDDIRRLMIVVNRIDGIYERMSANMGVKANLICLLYALDDGMPHSQKQICEDWLLPRSTLNTITKECEKNGFVILQPIPGKRRETNIVLTQAGSEYARKHLDKIYRAEESAFSSSAINTNIIECFEDFCEKLKDAFEALNRQEDDLC